MLFAKPSFLKSAQVKDFPFSLFSSWKFTLFLLSCWLWSAISTMGFPELPFFVLSVAIATDFKRRQTELSSKTVFWEIYRCTVVQLLTAQALEDSWANGLHFKWALLLSFCVHFSLFPIEYLDNSKSFRPELKMMKKRPDNFLLTACGMYVVKRESSIIDLPIWDKTVIEEWK